MTIHIYMRKVTFDTIFLVVATDIDECKHPNQYPCTGTCENTDGNYECFCPKGEKGDGKAGKCTKISENFPYPARVAIGKH